MSKFCIVVVVVVVLKQWLCAFRVASSMDCCLAGMSAKHGSGECDNRFPSPGSESLT